MSDIFFVGGKKRKADEITNIPRRKPMSESYPTKPWTNEDLAKAIAAEKELNQIKEDLMLKITFPEKDITADTVQALSSSIERTHFQVPCTARFCYVQLKEGSDVEKIMEELNKTQFNGEGFLKCERKPHKTVLAKHEQNNKIDPFTLYVGNLPLVLPSNLLKDAFSECQRVDMGYAQRMKCTRYAFVRFHTVDQAIEAFKKALTMRIDSRSLIVRFRRCKSKESEGDESDLKNVDHEDPNHVNDEPKEKKRKESEPNEQDYQLVPVQPDEPKPQNDTEEIVELPSSVYLCEERDIAQTQIRVRKDGTKWVTDGSGRTKKLVTDDDLQPFNSPETFAIKDEPEDPEDDPDDDPDDDNFSGYSGDFDHRMTRSPEMPTMDYTGLNPETDSEPEAEHDMIEDENGLLRIKEEPVDDYGSGEPNGGDRGDPRTNVNDDDLKMGT